MSEVKGRDKFGTFLILQGKCCRCGLNTICIKYDVDKFELPLEIAENATIIKSAHNTLGFACGCYLTFGQQVAHIEDYYKWKKEKEKLKGKIVDLQKKLNSLKEIAGSIET